MGKSNTMRVGFGYDVHRLVEGRPLVLGGVKIPHFRGLSGHSDADVLVHAIIDALLGASGLGDIGRHFPPQDPAYRDISSITLLERTYKLIKEKGFRVINIDSTIVAEGPVLKDYIPSMEENIARVLDCHSVNVKATTTEGLGPEGRGEGMAAYAVVLLGGGFL